ncbi:unannotated protein [freshwater metagenome]|uniref:Unannotated protein n=1 Tax=freshwater metagenome TaxID=449393 RepID=A0A6J7EVH1_9ZZZZ|nr:nucleic acid-binding protein [Actinomycetota bacterium]
MSSRLAPSMNPDTQFFWDGVSEHRLLIQRCTGCATLRHPPRPMCPRCNSVSWDTLESSGRGSVFSFVMPQFPQYPWFEYPYIVVLVDLDEGTRLVSNLRDIAPAEVTIGMRVEVFYEHHDDGLVLPQFRPEAQS